MREILKLTAGILILILVFQTSYAKGDSSSTGNGKNLSVDQKTVTGIVTDSNSGQSLIGVNIIIQGSTTGTVTDLNGNFSLEVPDLNSTCIFLPGICETGYCTGWEKQTFN
jgi:hypothetical protein